MKTISSIFVFCIAILTCRVIVVNSRDVEAIATVVESIPVGDFDVEPVDSVVNTWEVLISLLDSAKNNVDITAVYWNLLGIEDRKTYNATEMEKFGAERGTQLYNALENVLQRGVLVRLLLSNGIGGDHGEVPKEVQYLVDKYPSKIKVQKWDGSRWYEGGIVHQKLWIIDKTCFYVGSANMDWKSLAQVMELGVVVKNSGAIVAEIVSLFDSWWHWTSEGFNSTTTQYFSTTFQVELKVPSWSSVISQKYQAPNPFEAANLAAKYNITHPIVSKLNGTWAKTFIGASPMGILSPYRVFDETSLQYTILDAKKEISLSVMDFEACSRYYRKPISWRALEDALLSVIFSKGIHVRLLISVWAHTALDMIEGLHALSQSAAICKKTHPRCKGQLEIKLFEVPGWQNTSIKSEHAEWPSFTRVNHGKYIVTDRRVNIGTSNMLWDYFYTTGGISFNTNHEALRATTQQIFNRNWNSPYSKPLKDTQNNVVELM